MFWNFREFKLQVWILSRGQDILIIRSASLNTYMQFASPGDRSHFHQEDMSWMHCLTLSSTCISFCMQPICYRLSTTGFEKLNKLFTSVFNTFMDLVKLTIYHDFLVSMKVRGTIVCLVYLIYLKRLKNFQCFLYQIGLVFGLNYVCIVWA